MRLHLPTLLSSLLARSLLYQTAVSLPLEEVNLKPFSLEAELADIFSTWGLQPTDPSFLLTRRQSEAITWEQALNVGRRNIAKLEDPDSDCPEEIPPYTSHYIEGGGLIGPPSYATSTGPLPKTLYWPAEFLEAIDVSSTSDAMTVKAVFSQEYTGRPKNARPVTQNGFIREKGVIFALSNYRSMDKNGPRDQLQPGEIMMQVWDEIAGPGGHDQLKWIVRSHITRVQTMDLIRQAPERVGFNQREVVRITRSDNSEVFEALSGSENCKGVYPTLATHAYPRFADKRVTELVLWDENSSYSFIAMKIE
ncbi:hypothetical protein BJY04DRAFT_219841 [Aspergillus karnatakaensis]|uniref:uncharacterized protein n=1 Tax=Aspergillus karnatakaensis TaxID=1810916 RepID=UPI003CCCFD56